MRRWHLSSDQMHELENSRWASMPSRSSFKVRITDLNIGENGFEIRMTLDRITRNPEIMGGKPCTRGMRVTVGTIVGLVASGHSESEILTAYPYLELDDIRQVLAYAGWRSQEIEIPLPAA